MLWYKAWLETRWRFAFVLGSIVLVWLLPLWLPSRVPASKMFTGVALETVLLSIFAAIYLAGAGVNTQTSYAATTGFHGSMLFTLSLPVSRRRLLFVRAGLGAIQTCALVLLMVGYTLYMRPETTDAWEAGLYGTRAVACAMAVYAFSVLLACVLDEMWQFTGACLFWAAFFLLESRVDLVERVSPLRGMSLLSYPVTGAMPWAPVLASLVVAGGLICASVVVLERKEY